MEDPVGDAVQWIKQQRRQGNTPRIGANRDVTKLTREQAIVLNKAVPKRVPPAPPTSKSSAIATAQKVITESFHTSPETDSDDDLFELRLPSTDHAAPKTQFQLFNEEYTSLAAPVRKSPHNTAAATAEACDAIDMDLHSRCIGAGTEAAMLVKTSASVGPKITLRKSGTERRQGSPRVSWHPDVQDQKLMFAEQLDSSQRREATLNPESNAVLRDSAQARLDEASNKVKEDGIGANPVRRRAFTTSHRDHSNVTPGVSDATTIRAVQNRITKMFGQMLKFPRILWR
ncbi:hypothetical protein [Burkholderia cepacia]|nr:hypothetical protein [Burkholderia cepacia]